MGIGRTIFSSLACLSFCYGYSLYLERDIPNIIYILSQNLGVFVCSGFLTSWVVNFWEKLKENSLCSRTMGKLLNEPLHHEILIRENCMHLEELGVTEWIQRHSQRTWHMKEHLLKYKTNCLPLSHLLVAWQDNMSRLTYLLRNVLFPSSPEARILRNGIQQPPKIWNLLQKFVLSCTHF